MDYVILVDNVSLYSVDGLTYLGTLSKGEIIKVKDIRECEGSRQLAFLEDGTCIISQINDNPPIIEKLSKKKGKKSDA